MLKPLALSLALLAAPLTACAATPGPETAATVQDAAADMRVPRDLARRGVQRFRVDWAGAPIPLWYFRPQGVGADAPVLFVFHGVRRDADRYIAEWIDIAQENGVIVAVPEFTQSGFPGARGYNHGNILTESGQAVPRDQWTFAALEPLFDALVAREHLAATRYNVFGHSAGAQFVHRFMLTGGSPRVDRAISANAGSYSFPTESVDWPFGMGALPAGLWDPAKAYAQPMTVMLGTADNDPDYPSLPRDPEAMAQGPHRLARGQAFYAAARADAAARGVPFRWRCLFVPGIGHDNGGMAPYAMAVLRGQAATEPGSDCATIVRRPTGGN